MPVSLKVGEEGSEQMVREISYREIEGAWFPESCITSFYSSGSLRYSVSCDFVSVEINQRYPDNGFDIVYPAGTEIEDVASGRTYMAGQ